MVQNTAQAMAPKRLKKGGKGPLIITGAVLAVLIAAYIGLCAWASSLDTFFQGYQINGIDVGGLTAAQAQEKLTQELPEREVPIYETPDGTDPHGTENEEPLLILTLAQLGFTPESAGESVGIPFSDWAQEALDSQRGMSFFVKGFSYLSSLVRGDGMWFGFQLSGDIEAAVSDLADRLDQEAVDAAYELGEDSISITKPRDGRSVSQDALRQYLAQLDGASVKLYVSFTTIPAQTLTVQEIYDETSGEVKNASYDAETGIVTNLGSGASMNGLVLTSDGTAYVAPTAEVGDSFDAMKSTAYYRDVDDLYVTAYVMDVTANKTVDSISIAVENAVFDGWLANGVKVTAADMVGADNMASVYADIITEIYDVRITADGGIGTVAIDGVVLTKNGNTFTTNGLLAAGTYEIDYMLNSGFNGDNVKITVNGQEVTGNTITLSGTPAAGETSMVISISIYGTEPVSGSGQIVVNNGSDDMSLTDILLIVLVVLIVIMAVIVALRLMRS